MDRNRTQASQNSKQRKNQTSTPRGANQSTLEEVFSKSQLSPESFEKFINRCVRYILVTAGNNLPIRKTDLVKNVLVNCGRNFDKIIKEVARVLDKTYGYKLQVCDENANNKSYILTSKLQYDKSLEYHHDVDEDAYKCLLMLVLMHIYMLNSSVTEAVLISFLNSLKINFETRHRVFGNVKAAVGTMVKQKYLTIEKDQNDKNSYAWGARAEKAVSKHELLKLACKIDKTTEPKNWKVQFEDARTQFAGEENPPINGEG